MVLKIMYREKKISMERILMSRAKKKNDKNIVWNRSHKNWLHWVRDLWWSDYAKLCSAEFAFAPIAPNLTLSLSLYTFTSGAHAHTHNNVCACVLNIASIKCTISLNFMQQTFKSLQGEFTLFIMFEHQQQKKTTKKCTKKTISNKRNFQ